MKARPDFEAAEVQSAHSVRVEPWRDFSCMNIKVEFAQIKL